MKTLNEIKELLKAWFNNHGMINSVFYENDFDFNSERNITYPVANIEYINSSVNQKTMNHNFKITIADQTLAEDGDMEDRVISDSLQVAEDFYTYIHNLENGIIWNQSSSIEPFTDDTGDRTTGVTFSIQLGIIRPANRCWTPSKT